MTVTRHGAIVGRDRRELLDDIEDEYGEQVADQVMLAMLPPDERLHVEQHRHRLERENED